MEKFCFLNYRHDTVPNIPLLNHFVFFYFGAEERTRTSTGLPPQVPETCVSTNSTTPALFSFNTRHPWRQIIPLRNVPIAGRSVK